VPCLDPFASPSSCAGRHCLRRFRRRGDSITEAWAGLTSYEKPFLTIWASNDPGQLGSCEAQQRLIDNVPGAAGHPHDRLPEASHFLQDDQGTEIAARMVEWYASLDEEPT